jgi:hypothetical protein
MFKPLIANMCPKLMDAMLLIDFAQDLSPKCVNIHTMAGHVASVAIPLPFS